eukprot:jgi/Botrbrau1/939/Bobra.0167s0050.1
MTEGWISAGHVLCQSQFRDVKCFCTPDKGLLNAYEAERIVQGLVVSRVEEVGTEAWFKQHAAIEKLNLQAHFNAQQHADEFVVEALVSHDKLGALIHDLLVTEAWKEQVLPLTFSHLANNTDSITAYILLYHEAALANLLELLPEILDDRPGRHQEPGQDRRRLRHSAAQSAVLSTGTERYRRTPFWSSVIGATGRSSSFTTLLQYPSEKKAGAPFSDPFANSFDRNEPNPEEILARGPEDDLKKKQLDVEFVVALCALSILRYISDQAEELPMSVGVRLVSTNDTLLVLAPLMDKPPWVQRCKGSLYKWDANQWRLVPPEDHLRLDKVTAQTSPCKAGSVKAVSSSDHYVEGLHNQEEHVEAVRCTPYVFSPLKPCFYHHLEPLGWRGCPPGMVTQYTEAGMSNHMHSDALHLQYTETGMKNHMHGHALHLQYIEAGMGALHCIGAPPEENMVAIQCRDLMGRLRGHMNEVLFDQLPVLHPLQRFADEIVLTDGGSSAPRGPLIVEQVPSLRSALLTQTDWNAIAEQVKARLLLTACGGPSPSSLRELAATLDFLCDLSDPDEGTPADANGVCSYPVEDVVKVHSWRQVGKDVFESWHAFDMLIDRSRASEPVTVSSATGATSVKGERYRLKEVEGQDVRGLPPKGKICVTYQGTTVEAILELPGAETRETVSQLSPSLWVTVGVLASDGFAFQVCSPSVALEPIRCHDRGRWGLYKAGYTWKNRLNGKMSRVPRFRSPEDAVTEAQVDSNPLRVLSPRLKQTLIPRGYQHQGLGGFQSPGGTATKAWAPPQAG